MKHDIPSMVEKAIKRQRLRVRDLRGKTDPTSISELSNITANLTLLESIKDAFNGDVAALRDYA